MLTLRVPGLRKAAPRVFSAVASGPVLDGSPLAAIKNRVQVEMPHQPGKLVTADPGTKGKYASELSADPEKSIKVAGSAGRAMWGPIGRSSCA
ncbi:hypothetical protein [Paeniglutamicibacter cryotolerans]|uniref:Uncharacterized protein n=1 Tax=Paeniglutamicibacter cryotolerans TaxID=670079 RepID=A0A839QNM5_9MICC|nr:hypothetical protein [Paeniglutamicibacter cryotolerans]MBB2997370.1 hypothetical protein [Paeniglutamicibacter cryotolerans]